MNKVGSAAANARSYRSRRDGRYEKAEADIDMIPLLLSRLRNATARDVINHPAMVACSHWVPHRVVKDGMPASILDVI